ncbi:MAG: AAA family ATPase, partial [Mariprofundales bacterium]
MKNIDLLSNRIPLNPIEKKILAFSTLASSKGYLEMVYQAISINSEARLCKIIGLALETPPSEIRKNLTKKSTLLTSGLITLSMRSSMESDNLIEFEIMSCLDEALRENNENEAELIGRFIDLSKPPMLTASDFPHLDEDIKIIEKILRHSLKNRRCGTNILFYGAPGTGKTELARLLATKLKTILFEVKTTDDESNLVFPKKRLEMYCFSQQFLGAGQENILLFDEVEDAFPMRRFSVFGLDIRSGENKGRVNRILEENRTPSIWISNEVQQIDPSFLRRFDYVLEVNTPPRSVRLNIIEHAMHDLPVTPTFMASIAEHGQFSPAEIDKVSRVLRILECESEVEAERALERMLGNTLRLSNSALPPRKKQSTTYSLELLNTPVAIPPLLDGLQRSGHGTLCFYGPPGTGKSALATHIAHHLDKPLISKRASDILSKWIGESEKNIANMFAQARSEEGVLLLDEADSFLRNRLDAKQPWEVTQVNELLVQME